MIPTIFGLAGTMLCDAERAFFKSAEPAGYILFKHNITDRDQLRALTDSLRDISGRDDLPILIDQEGGRVARMGPPSWPQFPAAPCFDALYDMAPMTAIEAARCNAEALALMLYDVGITVNCAPVLDIRTPHTHSAIADRALGAEPLRVAALGRAVLDGLHSGGVIGMVKHMPGQGRAEVDSHHDLPFVMASADELALDLEPFIQLKTAPMGLVGHIVFEAWDGDHCASMSPTVIEQIIRQRIGFDGLLISDDLHMNALQGDIVSRSLACLAAGCDIALNCWGTLEDKVAIATALPTMADKTSARLRGAMRGVGGRTGGGVDTGRIGDLLAKRDALLAVMA